MPVVLGFASMAEAQNVSAVSAGHYTSFYVKSDGSLWAAGWNSNGQLGDGNATGASLIAVNASTPVLVMTRVSAVSTSGAGFHTLFLKDDGTVWAAGVNGSGQLGDGSNQDQVSPVEVRVGGMPMSGVSAISAGGSYSLFLKTDGTVWACGSNSAGELGDGTTNNRNTPVQVKLGGVPITGVTAISAGGQHSLFLKNDGTVWAVGENSSGQLGDGVITYPDDNTFTANPVLVMGGVKAIAAGGSSSFFLKTDGRVYAVGNNVDGHFGNGTTSTYEYPVRIPVQTMTGVAAVSHAGSHSLFLKTDGTVWAAGDNSQGQLGDGSTSFRATAVQVMTGVNAISAGLRHSLFVKAGGVVWATGSNSGFALGDGTWVPNRSYPQPIFAVARHHRISAGPLSMGGGYSLKTEGDGSVWGMGTGYGATPSQVNGLSYMMSISAGFSRSGVSSMRRLALDRHGKIWTWNTTVAPLPVELPGIAGVTAIFDFPIMYSACAIRSDRTVWRIDSPSEAAPYTITQVMNHDGRPLADAMQIGNGGNSFLALNSDRTISAWGVNNMGQLGDGTTTDRAVAAPVTFPGGAPFSDAVCVASGYSSSYAVTSDGTVWAWGNGYLGNGLTETRLNPIMVYGLHDAVAIHANHMNRFVIRTDGTVLAWGSNQFGQLGDNSTVTRLYPVAVQMMQGGVISPLTRVVEVATNGGSTFFRREDGSIYACGFNNGGQLGGSGNKLVATLVADY